MTRTEALKMRTAIHALLSFVEDDRYGVAIKQRFTNENHDEWEVHVFVKKQNKSGLTGIAVFMTGLEMLITRVLSVESIYDDSTIGTQHGKPSVKIW